MNWGRHNGIKSGVVAMLSGGFSGLSYTHTDIGGYTFIDSDINKYYQFTKRDKDLLIRWLELSAFSCVFRSHEGNKPDKTIQPYDDDMIHYLRRNAYLFRLLDEYRYPNCKLLFIRQTLFKAASRYGIPIMRALIIEF
jgi:alpha-glucosidase